MKQTSLCDFTDSAPLFPPDHQTLSLLPANDEEQEEKIEERTAIRINPAGKTPGQLNAELRLAIDNNTWHPDDLINYYEGLGIEIKSREGIIGLHEARQKNYCQFFTPLWISRLITDLLSIPENATVLDNAMGTGRLAWHLPNKKLFTGIEYEDDAYRIARNIYPDSCIIRDNLINHAVDNRFDYVLLNPPFSLNLKSLHGNLIHISYGGGILSHVAALETGLRALKEHGYLAAILPDNIWKLESTRVLHRWIKDNSQEIARIRLPKSTFTGTEWRTTLCIFKKQTRWYSNENEEPFQDELQDEDVTSIIVRFRESAFHQEILDYAGTRDSYEPVIFREFREEKKKKAQSINKRNRAWNNETPKVVVTAVRNRLHFIPNNALAAIKIENIKAHFGVEYDYSLRAYTDSLQKALRLDPAWADGVQLRDLDIFSYFGQYGLGLEFSPALLNWLKKKEHFTEGKTLHSSNG